MIIRSGAASNNVGLWGEISGDNGNLVGISTVKCYRIPPAIWVCCCGGDVTSPGRGYDGCSATWLERSVKADSGVRGVEVSGWGVESYGTLKRGDGRSMIPVEVCFGKTHDGDVVGCEVQSHLIGLRFRIAVRNTVHILDGDAGVR